MYAWHLAARTGWETTLFIEDDAELPDRFLQQLRQRLSMLSPGWMILNFGCPEAGDIGTGSRPCARGYVLSRAGVLAFRDGAGVIDQGADWLVFQLSAKTEADNTGACAQRRWLRPTPEDART